MLHNCKLDFIFAACNISYICGCSLGIQKALSDMYWKNSINPYKQPDKILTRKENPCFKIQNLLNIDISDGNMTRIWPEMKLALNTSLQQIYLQWKCMRINSIMVIDFVKKNEERIWDVICASTFCNWKITLLGAW